MRLHELVVATGNAGKLAEIGQLLRDVVIRVRSQQDFGVPSIEETGLSFVENALLKARHASAIAGLPALADDSGLAVDALGGAPGIRSARFAGDGAGDDANNRLLLERLADTPPECRGARFHCALALVMHAQDPVPLICEGSWSGVILPAPRGSNGFGYDPLFLVPSLGRSSAELDPAQKNLLSHRGQAFAALRIRLDSQC